MVSMAGYSDVRDQSDLQVSFLVELLKLASLINGPMQDGVAAPNKLSLNELKIVLCLSGEGVLAGHAIAELLGMAPMNVSRALASLRKRGWIEAVSDPTSKRRKPYQLSVKGKQNQQALLPDIGGLASFLLSKLKVSEVMLMKKAASRIIDRTGDWLELHNAGLKVQQEFA